MIVALDGRAEAEGVTRSEVIRRFCEAGLMTKAPKR
jgi:hypothetical protein